MHECFLFFCQKKKLKKPKENTSRLCECFIMHLREGVGGPIQVASHQERILNSLTSFLKAKSDGLHHDRLWIETYLMKAGL